MKKKLFILVRKDITPEQQAVQAGHAVAEFMLKSDSAAEWQNSTLVYLGVKDEKELQFWHNEAIWRSVEPFPFHEPDLQNEMTAFAVFSKPSPFRRLKLLNFYIDKPSGFVLK